jgi:exopolysaccharide biosynthesis polyprenyl glycosylphosphotransferase
MITHRLRGLVNLHSVATTVIAGVFFLLCVQATRYQPWVDLSTDVELGRYLLAVVIGMILSTRFITILGSRFHRLGWVDSAALAFRQITMVTLVVFTLIVATKDRSVSRVFLASYLVLTWGLLLIVNQTLPRALAKLAFSGHHLLPTLFIGHSRARARLEHWLAQKEHLGIRPVGFLSDEPEALAQEARSEGTRYLGPMQALARVIEERDVGQVILLDLSSRSGETERILEICQAAGCRLLIHNQIEEQVSVPLLPVVEDGHYFFTTQEEPLEDPMNRALKRLFDIAVSLPVVVLVLPVLSMLVLIMQRLQSPGPLMFSRARGGQRGSEFTMLKYRSMRFDAPDARLEAKQAVRGDSRIYSFGRFLRKTSLDEFPQFFNVLRGDMSIVGPRPHLPQHDVEFSQIAKTYRSRQLVKPGITGLAQTRGYRGEITDPAVLHKRVELDIHYITHWSIWLDVVITFNTVRHVFIPPKNAV